MINSLSHTPNCKEKRYGIGGYSICLGISNFFAVFCRSLYIWGVCNYITCNIWKTFQCFFGIDIPGVVLALPLHAPCRHREVRSTELNNIIIQFSGWQCSTKYTVPCIDGPNIKMAGLFVGESRLLCGCSISRQCNIFIGSKPHCRILHTVRKPTTHTLLLYWWSICLRILRSWVRVPHLG